MDHDALDAAFASLPNPAVPHTFVAAWTRSWAVAVGVISAVGEEAAIAVGDDQQADPTFLEAALVGGLFIQTKASMSPVGTNRTSSHVRSTVAIGGESRHGVDCPFW